MARILDIGLTPPDSMSLTCANQNFPDNAHQPSTPIPSSNFARPALSLREEGFGAFQKHRLLRSQVVGRTIKAPPSPSQAKRRTARIVRLSYCARPSLCLTGRESMMLAEPRLAHWATEPHDARANPPDADADAACLCRQAGKIPWPDSCWMRKSTGSPLPATTRPRKKTINLKKPVDIPASFMLKCSQFHN
jgi:hypothetical protein